MRPPHTTTAGFPLAQRRCRRATATGTKVSRAQVQLQREPSAKQASRATDVCGFAKHGRERCVYIEKHICLAVTQCKSIQISASQIGHSAQLCYSSVCRGIFDPTGIEDDTQTNYWFPGRPQKSHRFKATNIFHENSRRFPEVGSTEFHENKVPPSAQQKHKSRMK